MHVHDPVAGQAQEEVIDLSNWHEFRVPLQVRQPASGQSSSSVNRRLSLADRPAGIGTTASSDDAHPALPAARTSATPGDPLCSSRSDLMVGVAPESRREITKLPFPPGAVL